MAIQHIQVSQWPDTVTIRNLVKKSLLLCFSCCGVMTHYLLHSFTQCNTRDINDRMSVALWQYSNVKLLEQSSLVFFLWFYRPCLKNTAQTRSHTLQSLLSLILLFEIIADLVQGNMEYYFKIHRLIFSEKFVFTTCLLILRFRNRQLFRVSRPCLTRSFACN